MTSPEGSRLGVLVRQLQGRMPTLVTVLPAAPFDGQEVYFDAHPAQGVLWHLRYNASILDAYKWNVVGGPPIVDDTFGSTSTAAGVTTVGGPSLAAPVGGNYVIGYGARAYSATAPAYGNVSPAVQQVRGGAPIAVHGMDFWTAPTPSLADTSITPHIDRTYRVIALAGDVFRHVVSAAGSGGISDSRWLTITPVRVG